MTRSVASDEAASGRRPEGYRRPRAARLRTAREIRRTIRAGRSSRGRIVDVFFARSTAGRSRIGVVTPRHGRGAVARNLVRRRLTEIARLHVLPALEARRLDLDLVVRAKPAAYDASYERLRTTLMDSLETVCAG
ncbi:ribonuclease P protein component [Candidatus Palauibacter polyketidifaciens]|uniref:ribonuclease P protein component n=1 Tax=Candidatus Palauibacter polyketidifaciens TaxID=3056740 RepID=UPI00139BBEF0|nr:ribonuclease P protein component [Candidatus Palauibacter polyketidifaciens]MDE2719159.1 ribonuclease P protein component [Candidatus Palauibacter polyketidifaciens]MYE33861.1 ribonuclease P protein component [Gemmatimonadales bacterium]